MSQREVQQPAYFGEFGTQVGDQVVKARRGLIALASVALVLGFLFVVAGSVGGARVIPASRATALGLFSGKNAKAAITLIVGQVTGCGRETGTIEKVAWTGPPLRVAGDTLGTNPSLQVPNSSGQSMVTCLAALNLSKGATAQQCPGVALGSSGALTADARAFVATYVSCETTVGGS